MSTATGNTNGRGLLSFTLSLSGSTSTINTVFYVIDATKVFLMSSDPTGSSGTNTQDLLTGQLGQQAGTYTAASLNGNFLYHATGLYTSTAGSTSTYTSQAQLGSATFNGTTGVSLTLDTNNGITADGASNSGTGPWNAQTSTTTYTVASNGRVNLAATGAPLFYLAGSTTSPSAFSLDFSGQANAGGLEPQTITSWSGASITGSYSGGTIDPAAQNTAYAIFEFTAVPGSGGAGTFTPATQDQNQASYLIPAQSLSGTTYTYTTGSNGRFVVGTGSGAPTILYGVGSNKAYIISLFSGNPVLIELTHQ